MGALLVPIGIPNNLPENRASKTNLDGVEKKVNSETKSSLKEKYV